MCGGGHKFDTILGLRLFFPTKSKWRHLSQLMKYLFKKFGATFTCSMSLYFRSCNSWVPLDMMDIWWCHILYKYYLIYYSPNVCIHSYKNLPLIYNQLRYLKVHCFIRIAVLISIFHLVLFPRWSYDISAYTEGGGALISPFIFRIETRHVEFGRNGIGQGCYIQCSIGDYTADVLLMWHFFLGYVVRVIPNVENTV